MCACVQMHRNGLQFAHTSQFGTYICKNTCLHFSFVHVGYWASRFKWVNYFEQISVPVWISCFHEHFYYQRMLTDVYAIVTGLWHSLCYFQCLASNGRNGKILCFQFRSLYDHFRDFSCFQRIRLTIKEHLSRTDCMKCNLDIGPFDEWPF